MGAGSDIAIEAADMVLLDSFAGIIEAVKYGRVVYDNLKKTIWSVSHLCSTGTRTHPLITFYLVISSPPAAFPSSGPS